VEAGGSEAAEHEEGVGEEAAGLGIFGTELHGAFEGGDCFGGLAEAQVGGAEEGEGGKGLGELFGDGLEDGDGFGVAASHMEGDAEVEFEAGVGGEGFDELVVDGDGGFELAGSQIVLALLTEAELFGGLGEEGGREESEREAHVILL